MFEDIHKADGNFPHESKKDLYKEEHPYKEAYVILVSPKHIKCISIDELKESEIEAADSRHLKSFAETFELREEDIDTFHKLASDFLGRFNQQE